MSTLIVKSLQAQLQTVSKEIQEANDNIEINTIVENFVTKLMDSEFASIWFYDAQKGTLLRERGSKSVREISINKKCGVLYKCFMTKEHAIYNYLTSEKGYEASVDNPDDIKMKSKVMLPLIDNDRLIGIVTAYTSVKKVNVFTEDDLEVLKAISPYIIDTIYKMHPDAKIDVEDERSRRKDHSKRAETEALHKVQKVQNSRAEVETSDETLAFMSNSIHDIRTPANTLFGFLDLLQEQVHEPRLSQYIQNAKESAGLINDLTTSILDRISSQREREESKKEKIDSVKFFSSVAEMFSSNMYSKKLHYNVFIDPLMPKEILTESLKLKRIIMNLINNAYKFTPTNHSVEFSVRYKAKDKKLIISVKDTGIGIAQEKQKDIFKAFKQAEDTTVLNYGGTGLGLAISSDYVKDLGGQFKLQSETDKGSEFSFDIPVDNNKVIPSFAPINNKDIKIAILMDGLNNFSASNIAKYLSTFGLQNEQIVAVASSSTYPSDMTHLISFQNKTDSSVVASAVAKNFKCMLVEENLFSVDKDDFHNSFELISQYTCYVNELYAFISSKVMPKVLIVDDDKISVSLIKTLLEGEFCKVSVAMDGEEALNLLISAQRSGDPFSLAYLDNKMPVISGLGVIKRFRAYEKEKQLKPIYAVSISGDILNNEDDRKHFNAFTGKPFEKKDIREALYKIS